MKSPTMRILEVIETGGPGGAETIFIELSAELKARGHEVFTFIGDTGWLNDALRGRGVRVRIQRSLRTFDLSNLRALIDTIRANKIEIVHAHLFDGALYAGIAGWLCGVPVVTTLHGQADVRAAGLRMAIKRFVMRRTMQRVAFVSEALRVDVASLVRLVPARSVVIPNGVRRSVSDQAEPRTREPNRFELVAIGNIRRPKGYQVLLDALSQLVGRYPFMRLRIAGSADEEAQPLWRELHAQVDQLHLADHVEFLGFVSDPWALLADADCFVLSSFQEGFSLATIEAMLAGVPVVATRSGGPEELIVHNDTGVLVRAGDADALAVGIAQILDAPDDASRLARQAREVAIRNFGVSTMVDAYEKLFRDVLHR